MMDEQQLSVQAHFVLLILGEKSLGRRHRNRCPSTHKGRALATITFPLESRVKSLQGGAGPWLRDVSFRLPRTTTS